MKTIITLLTTLLTSTAFAASEGISCRTISEPGNVARGDTYTERVVCDPGIVLTGGGESCTDPNGTSLIIPSSTFPQGVDPTIWVCNWENTSASEASCVCDAICCSMAPVDVATQNCTHEECGVGIALELGCSECVDTVCACDPFCCETSWDSFCVHEAQQLCGLDCGSNNTCLDACGCP